MHAYMHTYMHTYFLTCSGAESLPPSNVLAAGAVAKEELRNAISGVIAQMRGRTSASPTSAEPCEPPAASPTSADPCEPPGLVDDAEAGAAVTTLSEISVNLPGRTSEQQGLEC